MHGRVHRARLLLRCRLYEHDRNTLRSRLLRRDVAADGVDLLGPLLAGLLLPRGLDERDAESLRHRQVLPLWFCDDDFMCGRLLWLDDDKFCVDVQRRVRGGLLGRRRRDDVDVLRPMQRWVLLQRPRDVRDKDCLWRRPLLPRGVVHIFALQRGQLWVVDDQLRRDVQRRVLRRLLLPRGVHERNGEHLPDRLLLPRGLWRARCVPVSRLHDTRPRCPTIVHGDSDTIRGRVLDRDCHRVFNRVV